MKRIIVASLVAGAVWFAACGDEDGSTTSSTADATAAEPSAVLGAARRARNESIELAGGDNAVDGTLPSDLLGPYTGDPSGPSGPEASEREFATFGDDTGALSVQAPSDWQTWSRRSPTLDNGPGMIVSDGDPKVFHSQEFDLTIDGVNFIASAQLAQRLGITDSSARGVLAMTSWLTEEIGFFDGACGEYGGVSIYERGEYYGISRVWTDCGGTGKVIKDVAALPADGSYVTYVQLTYSPKDSHVADRVFNTFSVDRDAL